MIFLPVSLRQSPKLCLRLSSGCQAPLLSKYYVKMLSTVKEKESRAAILPTRGLEGKFGFNFFHVDKFKERVTWISRSTPLPPTPRLCPVSWMCRVGVCLPLLFAALPCYKSTKRGVLSFCCARVS